MSEDQKVQVNAMYLRGLRSVYEFKAGAASSTANNAHCEAGAGAAAYFSPQPRSRKRSTLFSRMEEELVVPSPPAPGVARQLLPDTVDIERRMYETMPKSDLTAGMVKGEDGRTRFKIIEFWRAMKPRYPLHAALAFRVYSVLPTEANCERVFSRAGNNMTHLRRNKTQDTVRIGDGGLLLEQPR